MLNFDQMLTFIPIVVALLEITIMLELLIINSSFTICLQEVPPNIRIHLLSVRINYVE